MLSADAVIYLPYLSLPCSCYALTGCGSNPPPTLGRMTPPRALCMEYVCEGQSARLDLRCACFWLLHSEMLKSDETQTFEENKPVRPVMDSMQISWLRNPNPLGLC